MDICEICHRPKPKKNSRYCSRECYLAAVASNEEVFGFGAEPYYNFDLSSMDQELFPHTQARILRKDIYDKYEGFTGKILCISDLEIPFHNSQLIVKAAEIAVENGCVGCVIGGDALNHYCVGSFGQDKDVSLKLERDVGIEVFSYLKDHFELVIAIEGNHEYRIKRFLSKQKNFPYWKVLLENEEPDLLKIVCQRSNVEYAGSWWVKIGDTIWCHPQPYSKVWGKNVTNSIDFFNERRDMDADGFGCLVQGHSHKALVGRYQGITAIETGCLCKELDFNVGIARTQPLWSRGFAILAMKDGKHVFNESRLYIFRDE